MEEKLDSRIPKTFVAILLLYLSIKGRIDFLQLERFLGKCKSGFCYFFERSFDFLTFSQVLKGIQIKGKTALAYDSLFFNQKESTMIQDGIE